MFLQFLGKWAVREPKSNPLVGDKGLVFSVSGLFIYTVSLKDAMKPPAFRRKKCQSAFHYCLSVFDHFVALMLKRLDQCEEIEIRIKMDHSRKEQERTGGSLSS